MRAHFDYERGLFCNSETYYDCEEHSKKHDIFYKRLYALENPVSIADINWAANWLAHHIKNTDFQYKFKLNNYIHEVPRPYVWQPWLQVSLTSLMMSTFSCSRLSRAQWSILMTRPSWTSYTT